MASPRQRKIDACIAELGHIEEDALYSARGHFEAAAGWEKLHRVLGLPVAVLSGVAGVSALSSFDKHNTIAGVLALTAAAVGAIAAFLSPSDRAGSHHNFGNDYNALRNAARIARTIEGLSLDPDALAARVRELSDRRDRLNKKAPQIPRRAFERGRRGIEQGEATYADAPVEPSQ